MLIIDIGLRNMILWLPKDNLRSIQLSVSFMITQYKYNCIEVLELLFIVHSLVRQPMIFMKYQYHKCNGSLSCIWCFYFVALAVGSTFP